MNRRVHVSRGRAALLLATALAGCTVGPTFERPAVPTQSGYLAPGEAVSPAAATADVPSRWWTLYGSPELDALVDRALANNRSLAASNATLARARAQLAAIRGTQLPQVDANARIEREQINFAAFGFDGDSVSGIGSNPVFNLYSVGGGISYDVDLFGGRRRCRG